jgi:hypothetical protein
LLERLRCRIFWALRADPEALGTSSDGIENTPLTVEEQQEVARRFEALHDYVALHFDLTREQLRAIEVKLDEVADRGKRVGRKDLRLLLLGAGLDLILSRVPPHVVETMLAMAFSGLAHIFGVGGLPPSIHA